MSFLLTKDPSVVCRERAEVDASSKYDRIIKEKREKYSLTKNIKIMQEIIKLTKQRSSFKEEAFDHHMAKYVMASDSVSNKTSDSVKKASGLKEFSDYLIAELDRI